MGNFVFLLGIAWLIIGIVRIITKWGSSFLMSLYYREYIKLEKAGIGRYRRLDKEALNKVGGIFNIFTGVVIILIRFAVILWLPAVGFSLVFLWIILYIGAEIYVHYQIKNGTRFMT